MFDLPTIYPITDTRLSPLSPADQVEEMASGGARLIQIRAKATASGGFLSEAVDALVVARRFGATLIVNDRVDVAIASGANGVHLGQNDLPPRCARKLLGIKAIIGFSTHNVFQAEKAMREPIDYIAVGPVFPTSTKADHDPVVGLDIVRSVRQAIGDFPLVAIGGITPENAKSVMDAGANSVAIIDSMHAKGRSIKDNTLELLTTLMG